MRLWHIEDLFEFLRNSPLRAFMAGKQSEMTKKEREAAREIYTSSEFQEWFSSGISECRKHEYPVVWHVCQHLACPRCHPR
jgi:hypothetical protein